MSTVHSVSLSLMKLLYCSKPRASTVCTVSPTDVSTRLRQGVSHLFNHSYEWPNFWNELGLDTRILIMMTMVTAISWCSLCTGFKLSNNSGPAIIQCLNALGLVVSPIAPPCRLLNKLSMYSTSVATRPYKEVWWHVLAFFIFWKAQGSLYLPANSARLDCT